MSEILYALVYHDTHNDPGIYVGTLEDCQRACVVLVYAYLKQHPWREHQTAADTLDAIDDDAEAAEWAMEYCNEHTEYLRCEIVETRNSSQV